MLCRGCGADSERVSRTEIKLVLTDINSDGSTDILIWQKIFLSRLIKETDKDDFVFDSEQLYAMYFNKDTKTFSKLTPVNWE